MFWITRRVDHWEILTVGNGGGLSYKNFTWFHFIFHFVFFLPFFLPFIFYFFLFHSHFLVHTTDSLGLCFTIQGDISLRWSQWKTEFLPCHFNSFLAPRDAVLLHICVQLSQAVWWDSGWSVRKYWKANHRVSSRVDSAAKKETKTDRQTDRQTNKILFADEVMHLPSIHNVYPWSKKLYICSKKYFLQ